MKRFLLALVVAPCLSDLPAAADTVRTFDVDVLFAHGRVTGTTTFADASSSFTASNLTAMLEGVAYSLPFAYTEDHSYVSRQRRF